MVFNKSLFASLLLTSSLVVISSAKAGFDEQSNFRLSVAKLKKGYEEGVITLKDGKKFSVQNANLWDQPNFFMVWDDSEKIYGGPNFDYSTYTEDGYRFTKVTGGGPRYVQNPETGEWYYDYDQLEPDFDVFSFILRPIKEEKEVGRTSNEKVIDLLSASTSSPFLLASSSTPPTEEDSSPAVSKVSSAKILIEPSQVTNTTPLSFHSEHIAGRNLWVGIELMTPESRSWWTQRLGHEAYMHFGKQVENERKRLEDISEEERTNRMENERLFLESVASIVGRSYEGNVDLLPPYVKEIEEFMGLRGANHDGEFIALCSENSPESSAQNNDYLSVWRGFQYNLDYSPEAPTWIAYVSSEPVEGPLYAKFPVTSPQIKMAMTQK